MKILALWFIVSHAEVFISRIPIQVVYDKDPILRIRVLGISSVPVAEIKVTLSVNGVPTVTNTNDFIVSVDKYLQAIILQLRENRSWVPFQCKTFRCPLTLSNITISGEKVSFNPFILARIIQTPSVNESTKVIYRSLTKEISIFGTGFIGADNVNLFFSPPLYRYVNYEITSALPLSTNIIVLSLRYGYSWLEGNGILRVVGIDTGAGPVKVGGDTGIVVATVEDDGMYKETLIFSSDQRVYQDTPYLVLNGKNFPTTQIHFKCDNGISDITVENKIANFTINRGSDSAIILILQHGSLWRNELGGFPMTLSVTEMDIGHGYMDVHDSPVRPGIIIALIYQRPIIFPSRQVLHVKSSKQLNIYGSGFPLNSDGIYLKFSSSLIRTQDYTLFVVNSSYIILNLMGYSSWYHGNNLPILLNITAINTMGMDFNGWINMNINIANIIAENSDNDDESNGLNNIKIFSSNRCVYESANNQSIFLNGFGFFPGMRLFLSPSNLVQNKDFLLIVQSISVAELRLKEKKKWSGVSQDDSTTLGTAHIGKMLFVESIQDKNGHRSKRIFVPVAKVLTDPVIQSAETSYHVTQSRIVSILGSGFTEIEMTRVYLSATNPSNYRIKSIKNQQLLKL